MDASFYRKKEAAKKEREQLVKVKAAAELQSKKSYANLMAVNGIGLGKAEC
jgi:hypothetical protein